MFYLLTLALIIMPESELFSQSCDQFKYALDFLQKYKELLNQPQNDTIINILRKTREDGFKYLKGNDKILKSINTDSDYSISFSDGKYNVSFLEEGIPILECQFPANYGMMTFSNKIDLEKKMASKIKNIPESFKQVTFNIPKSKLDSVEYSDLFVEDKGYYITPRLRNLVVYTALVNNSDSCRLLTDFEGIYLLESIQNMMLTGYWNVPIDVNLSLSEYGYKKSHYHVPLAGLYEMLQNEGSIPYWGVDSFDGKIIRGVYVWKNEYGGFNHVMSVDIPIEIIKKGGDINASLFCYIRTDNLKALFQEFM